MRRFVSIWLTTWPTDRWIRRCSGKATGPVALAAPGQGGVRLIAVSPEAAAEGLVPDITVAEARALVPNLTVGDADPVGDVAEFQRLAAWCQRWTPRVATDGDDGLLLDITGCGHLFGGDGSLLSDIAARFTRAGIGHRFGAAPTPVAA